MFAVGNESRGDDALGPRLARAVEQAAPAGVRVVGDFQLQIEHALDIDGADLVLFVDAAQRQDAALRFVEIAPVDGRAAVSHALAPAAVLGVYRQLRGTPPPAFVLGVAGENFELGAPLSGAAQAAETAAQAFLARLLGTPQVTAWRSLCG